MEIKVSMLIMSILSDVQEEMYSLQQRANVNINYAKYLVSTHKDMDTYVNPIEQRLDFAAKFPEIAAKYE